MMGSVDCGDQMTVSYKKKWKGAIKTYHALDKYVSFPCSNYL